MKNYPFVDDAIKTITICRKSLDPLYTLTKVGQDFLDIIWKWITSQTL